MKIIAFTGPMGSGKSTAVQYLKDSNLGKRIELVKFADPLYDIQEFIYRRVSPVLKRQEDFVKDRKLLQWLGTEWGRSIYENIWVDLWRHEVSFMVENYPEVVVVCDDVRFDNEAETVKKLGGYIIKLVTNKNEERITTNNGIAKHPSELGIDEKHVDFVINNNDTLDVFKNDLDAVFKLLLK